VLSPFTPRWAPRHLRGAARVLDYDDVMTGDTAE
jgi:hypothetical protein